jgi:hypothetical protein
LHIRGNVPGPAVYISGEMFPAVCRKSAVKVPEKSGSKIEKTS